MAFALINFQFARGIDSCYAQGQGVTTVMHTYRSLTDSASTILAADYFPPYIDGTLDKIFANDTILIVASDQVLIAKVLTVNPITLDGSSSINSANIINYSSTFSGGTPTHVTPEITFKLIKIGTFVTMSIDGVQDAGTTAVTPSVLYGALSFLPDDFLPAPGTLANGYFKIVQNSVISLGELQVTPLGVFIWANPNHTTTFNSAQSLSFGAGSVSYFTA